MVRDYTDNTLFIYGRICLIFSEIALVYLLTNETIKNLPFDENRAILLIFAAE